MMKHNKQEEAKETKGMSKKQVAAHMKGKEEKAEKMPAKAVQKVVGYKAGGKVKGKC